MEPNIMHVHQVIYMMQESGKTYEADELMGDIRKQFGDDVQFVACSGIPFPCDEVIPFLFDRNKIVLEGEKISLHPQLKLCDSDKK
ncbi:hypothetical protein FUAX_11730 [Fulvitalea axinellae]|uniref:DUF2492 family protein n=1 Tax=Fulvitalea axinellae TaxID=1182444 RepID=A0AAU9D7A2_9BACT|nr:hypothetical protein FUAX_11730 [Fulvitalea axinellae]